MPVVACATAPPPAPGAVSAEHYCFAARPPEHVAALPAASHVHFPGATASCCLAFVPFRAGLNMAVFLLIGKTSALTMNIAGVVKDWILILLSYLMYK